jgi:hypothetical protein
MVRQGDVDALYSANFSGAVFEFGNFPYTYIARGRKIAQLFRRLRPLCIMPALHYGPLETAPLEGLDPPKAATALLLHAENAWR